MAVVLMCLLLGVWSSGSALADRPPELNRADIQPNTWVLDPAAMAWEQRKPQSSPPPLDRYAACFVEKYGLVFLVTATSLRPINLGQLTLPLEPSLLVI